MSNDKKFVVQTQSLENYAAADWDGAGSFPHHWKYAFGDEYLVSGVDREQDALAHVAMNHNYSNPVNIQSATKVTKYETWLLEAHRDVRMGLVDNETIQFRLKNLILVQVSKA